MKQTKTTYIAIEDLIRRLGLLDEDVLSWIKRDNPQITLDHRGRKSVLISFLEKYSLEEDYTKAFYKAVAVERYIRDSDNSGANLNFKQARSKLLDTYEAYISIIESIHSKYLAMINKAGNETSLMAAYLLFSRVLSTLKMCCLCQRNNYWYWGSLLREIDEALDVAYYFVITKDLAEGRKALCKWFRENEAPKHADCRKVISNKMSAVDNTYDHNENYDLMNELYQKKSKFTHPTYHVIREVTKYRPMGDDILHVAEIEYGACSYERKLFELTDFFKSSIWTSVQYFLQCFQDLPLNKEDFQQLMTIHRKFLEEETQGFLNRTSLNNSL